MFLSGEQHSRFVPWHDLQKRLEQLQLNGLNILQETYTREGNRRFIDAVCSRCKKRKRYHVDNLLAGKTKACACRRNLKYEDSRANLLGERYDCMVQRCTRDTHKQSKDYKHKGRKVLFKSREHFIRWALKRWPDSDFKGLEFDRIDNEGHYSPENLRLVTSRENHLNRNGVVHLSFNGQWMHWADWPSPYSSRRTQALAAQGLTGEQIIKRAKQAVIEKRKTWLPIKFRLQQLGYATF
jgi:hypothetical protein